MQRHEAPWQRACVAIPTMATLFADRERRSRRLAWLGAVLPVAAITAAVGLMTLVCRQLLAEATAGDAVPALELPFYAGGACFLLAAVAVVVVQSMRIAGRVSGPEFRLVQSLQRIRSGDLAFRVHLRKGDLLADLAHECNVLLDWLNANPPVGSRTGSDLFEVGSVDVGPEEARP